MIAIKDKNQQVVGLSNEQDGMIVVHKPHLWDIGFGYLYTLEVTTDNDIYQQPFGIREIEIKNNQFLLNKKQVYFKGLGSACNPAMVSAPNSVSIIGFLNFSK